MFPSLGRMQVARIETADVMGVLKPIWTAKPETANRVRQRIEAVLDYASALGIRTGDNPARWRGHLDHLLPKPTKVKAVKHHPALPELNASGRTDLPSGRVQATITANGMPA
ncbi:MAG: hypothetical protein AAGM84_06720 [Pseudomonadota bacterium]